MATKLNTKFLEGFVSEEEIKKIEPAVIEAARTLHSGSGAGNDFIGWLDLPVNYDKEEFARIKKAAEKIKKCDVLIVIGIGGSYLGARAVIEAVKSHNYNSLPKSTPDIYFAGKSISADELNDLLLICEGKDVCVNVISKSGTTTEPALAFRVFRDLIEKKYGKQEAKSRIFVTTDKAKGTLKALADEEGFETFVVPDDIGGRFSVLTAVGLLPIAAACIDIDALMRGAAKAREELCAEDLSKNDCYKYAAIRNILYNKGKKVELLASYEPRFDLMAQWYKQLFGESEGKDGKGLFPCSVIFSTDLHSLGQYIQESGKNLMFETVVSIKKPFKEYTIEDVEGNIDGLNFLSGKTMSFVNEKAFEGTILAHCDGGVPNLVLEVPSLEEEELGYLIYFFEKTCAVSGYTLPSINPELKAIRRICLLFWVSPALRICKKSLKRE